MSELRDLRLDHLEEDVREIKAVLGRLEPLIIRMDQRMTSELPTLATKAELAELKVELAELKVELAEKPGKWWLAGAIAVLIAAYAAGLSALAALPVVTRLFR